MDFSGEGLHGWLDGADDSALDALDYGVIGLDRSGKTRRYSRYEADMAGFKRDSVLGAHFFKEIGRCMDNGLVAKRLDDALSNGETLDTEIDYVLAFRSAITPVKLRLLARPDSDLRYLLVRRLSSGKA